MIPLYTEEEYNKSPNTASLKLQCHQCKKEFFKTKKNIKRHLNDKHNDHCSTNCTSLSKKIITNCDQCSKEIQILPNQFNKYKHHFCNHKCATTYQNIHKTTGTRRSKLEIYIEQQLKSLYPNLEILFNDKQAINSELDIYIPSLKLAFELNGIFHYEPIHGQEKLDQITNNDNRKFAACYENNISLCIIDTSSQKYVKESTSKKYLDIITNLINKFFAE